MLGIRKRKKKIYLIGNGHYPTIHSSLIEAKKYLQCFPSYHFKTFPKFLYCEFSEKDFKECFCNCVFYEF